MANVVDIRKQTPTVQAQMLYALMNTKLLLKELSFFNGHPQKFVPGYVAPQDTFLKSFKDKQMDKYTLQDILSVMKNKDCIGWQFICALDEEDKNRAQLMNVPIALPIFEFQVFIEAGDDHNNMEAFESLLDGTVKTKTSDEHFDGNAIRIRGLLWRHWQKVFEEMFPELAG